jgi:mRNA interferase MazF
VCILTRDAAIDVLDRVTCAPITRTIRGIRSEVSVGASQGLPSRAVISCDNVLTISKSRLDPHPVGHLDPLTRMRLDRALSFALDIVY